MLGLCCCAGFSLGESSRVKTGGQVLSNCGVQASHCGGLSVAEHRF